MHELDGYTPKYDVEPQQDNNLKVSIGTEGGFVLIILSRPMKQIKMTKKDAREFARRIVKEAL